MVMHSSPLSGLVSFVVVIALLALVTGLALAGTDLLNPQTHAAAAAATDQATKDKAQRSTIDLTNYAAREADKTQAEQEQLRLQIEAQQNKLDQDLALAPLTRYVMLAVGTLATLIVSIALAVFLIQYGHSRLMLAEAPATRPQAQTSQAANVSRPSAPDGQGALPQAQTAKLDPWKDPIWRHQRILLARTQEQIWLRYKQRTVGGEDKVPPTGGAHQGHSASKGR